MDQTKLQVVSSTWTLTLKLLLPTFWFCFFGGLTILLFFLPDESFKDPLTPTSARLIMLSFLVSTAGLYYLLFRSIKWVALDETHIYVSNFFKSYQYTYDSVARVEETRVLLWNRVILHFHQPTQFGPSVVFLGSYYWFYFLKQHPAILEQLIVTTAKHERSSTSS